MLSIDDLLKFAERKSMPMQKRRGIMREYMQTLTLSFIQEESLAANLIFIGGTALRFFYDLQRFSEDLDFNYLGTLKRKDLEQLLSHIKRKFKTEGIAMDFSIRRSEETYFHWKVYIQFPEALQYYECGGKKGYSLHPAEKLSIQLDFQNLGRKKYPMEKKIIANFGKRFVLNTTSLEMFLAEKSNAAFFRNPARGRDFFDLMSLMHVGAKVNLSCIRNRDIQVKNKDEYCGKMQNRANQLNFSKLTAQLAPFLFREEDKEIMKEFPRYVEELFKNR